MKIESRGKANGRRSFFKTNVSVSFSSGFRGTSFLIHHSCALGES
jgi:hypothetical protein